MIPTYNPLHAIDQELQTILISGPCDQQSMHVLTAQAR